MKNILPENKLVLVFSKINLNENDTNEIEILIPQIKDWELFYRIAIVQGMGGLISNHITSSTFISSIPSDIVSRLNQCYLRILSRNMVLYDFFHKINRLFLSNSISIIPLKGIFLAEFLYIDIGLRQMSDIDFLVKKDDAVRCASILSEMGFVAKGREKNSFIKSQRIAKHLPTMDYKDVLVEIHFHVMIDDTPFEVDMDEYWDQSQTVSLNQDNIKVLSPEHLVQYQCIHLERHFNEGKIQLYQFADLVGLFRKYEKVFNWDKFIGSCDHNHCTGNVFRILYLLQQYFSVSFPEKVRLQTIEFGNQRVENLFLSYLECNNKGVSLQTKPSNLKNLKKIKGSSKKLKYFIGDIFPSKSFMYDRYHVSHKPLVYAYYFFRLIKGVSVLLNTFYNELFRNK